MSNPGIYDQVKYLTGLTQETINVHAYEVGQSFIEYMEEGDDTMIAKLERSQVFWNWWKSQFEKLSNEWLHEEGWHQVEELRREALEKSYLEYTKKRKVSQYGRRSYCFLVEDVLQPEWGKKQLEDKVQKARESFQGSNVFYLPPVGTDKEIF